MHFELLIGNYIFTVLICDAIQRLGYVFCFIIKKRVIFC